MLNDRVQPQKTSLTGVNMMILELIINREQPQKTFLTGVNMMILELILNTVCYSKQPK